MCPFVFTYSLTHPSLNAQQVICVFIHTYICVCLYLHCLLVYSSATFVPRAFPQTDITVFFMIYSLDCSTGLVIDLFLAYMNVQRLLTFSFSHTYNYMSARRQCNHPCMRWLYIAFLLRHIWSYFPYAWNFTFLYCKNSYLEKKMFFLEAI